MPRALTNEEKARQRRKLLERGKTAVMAQGLKRISIDPIAHAAGMAKGSFYQYFDSKERFLAEVVWFAEAERIATAPGDVETRVRQVLARLFEMPETHFFLRNFRDIEDAALASIQTADGQSFIQMEGAAFTRFLQMADIDTTVVDPGVVHNYIHLIYVLSSSDLMIADAVPATLATLTDSLVAYILRGAR